MSSLRISHHGRAPGDTKPSDPDRTPAGNADDSGFALRLAAGLLPKGDAAAQFGSAGADNGDSLTTPVKARDGRAKSDDSATALVVEGALGIGTASLAALPAVTGGGAANRSDAPAAIAKTMPALAAPSPRSPGLDASTEVVPTAAASLGADGTAGAAAASAANILQPPAAPTTIRGEAISTGLHVVAGLLSASGSAEPPRENAEAPSVMPDLPPMTVSNSAQVPQSPGPTSAATNPTPALTTTNLDAFGTLPDDPDLAVPAPAPGLGTGRPLANVAAALSPDAAPALVVAGKFEIGGFNSATADDAGRFAVVAGPRDATMATAAATFGSTAAAPLSANSTLEASAGPVPTTAGGVTEQFADQIAGQLVRMVSIGPREMVMRLHPPELGDLTLRVTVSGRDVTAWFDSPQPQVQSAISDAIGQLQTGLGNAGYNLNGAWVGGDAAGTGQQRQNSWPLPNRPGTAFTDPSPLSGATTSQPRVSGMSIYV